MDIKLEPNNLIADENLELVFIKEEKDDNPATEPSAHANRNYDLVQTNNIKKGLSLDGKSMKKKNRRARIFLCIVCGYMCKKKIDFYCHFSSNHFFNQKNLFKNEINKKNKNKIRSQVTNRGISLDADVKDEIEIVNHELKEDLDEIGEHENIDDFKLCSNEIIVSDHMSYCSKTDSNPVKSKICSKYSQQRQIIVRLCRIDGNSLEFECCSEKPDLFSSSFTQKIHLNRNLHTHSGQKPFKCNVCTKSFSQKNKLEYHLRTHTGENPFNCNFCTKSFSQESQLECHLRTHTGEKPFKCNVCTKSFSLKGNLNNHLRTHSGQKPFKCNVCTKSFSRKGNLNDHLRTHTGQKPFKCSICIKSFSRKVNLNRHLRTHTG